MMTGLLRNSVPQAGTAQEKMRALGMNSGNLVFWHALKRLFAPVDIAYAEKEKLSLCDKVIVTDLIWIRENANFEYLEKLVDSYAIPFIPISIGLQNDRFDPDFALNSGTCRLLKKMQERALLGVRGEYTADILSKHGIRNISVIGCPSMYYWGNPDLNISAQGKAERVSSNFRTFYGPLTVPEKHFLSYCADRDMQFIEQTEWAFTEDQAKDRKFFEYIDSWLSKSKILPLDFDEWSAALENMDFSKMGELLNQVQEKAKNIELELANREFSAKSGAGRVKVSANGKGEIIDVSIDDSLLEDKESLQILLISAINDVLAMVAQNRSSMANDVLGGFVGMKL